jgi:hypothetical protein
MIQIIAPNSAQRISDFMTEFPNGILNKKETGVGATHLAITNNQPYIICVPTIELIENKTYQHSNLLGVYGGIKKETVENYILTTEIPKIMVTYNSLPKLLTWLNDPYNTFYLLIDEYHSLLSDYSYRDEAIDGLIEESLKFKNKCFVSATPINPKYCPHQLKELDNYEIKWSTPTKIIPYRVKTSKPFNAVCNLIKKHKANNYSLQMNINNTTYNSKECYFFINSVKAISDILENTDLKDDEVKIICSNTERNKSLLKDWDISKVSDKNKPYTFITSKAFLGADFYSETGIVYIISSVYKKNTLYDIATDIFQIAGRIRTKENPFRDILYHIYNTGASDMTSEEFNDSVKQKTIDTELTIKGFNKLSKPEQQASLKRYDLDMTEDYVYYNPKTKELEFNYLKQLNEEFEFSIVNETYTNGLSIRDNYIKAGFSVENKQSFYNPVGEFIEQAITMSFKNVLKEYTDLIDCLNDSNCEEDAERISQLEQLEPSIKEIVSSLGTSKVRTIGYSKKSLTLQVYNNSDEAKKAIQHNLQSIFELNKLYSSKYVKEHIQNIYEKLYINRNAKATDLSEYFIINKKKRLVEGKTIDSIVIESYSR